MRLLLGYPDRVEELATSISIRLFISVGLTLVILLGSWSVVTDDPLMASDFIAPRTQGGVDITVREIIASGFTRPVQVTNAGDRSQRLFVVEQTGAVRIVQDGTVLPIPSLDISGLVNCSGEWGLLGVAFHPDYENNRLFYVNYTRRSDGDTVVARYSVSADPNRADLVSASTHSAMQLY